jgi:DNA-binding Lrp family transcriptional regulator
LEEAVIIASYVTFLDERRLGRCCSVFVEVTLSSQTATAFAAFEAAVPRCPEVMDCAMISGDYDYLLRVLAANPQDYERIHKLHLSNLPNVSRIKSSFVLRTICRRTAVPLSSVEHRTECPPPRFRRRRIGPVQPV